MAYITSQQFYSEIAQAEVSPVYVLAGEESYDSDEALRSIEKLLAVDSLNREVFFGNESKAEGIVVAAETLPFMGNKRLIVVKNANRMRAAEAEKISEFLKTPVESSCLVLMWPDKVTRETKSKALFKVAEQSGKIVEFKRLYDNEIPSWIQKKVSHLGKKISFPASAALAQESGSSLLDLSNEIEKLALFTAGRSEITADDVELVSGQTKSANLNRLAEVVEKGDVEDSVKIVDELLREGEEPIKILFRLYWVIRRLLVAKSLLEEDKLRAEEIRQALRLHNYFDRDFFQNLKKFSSDKLMRLIDMILTADLELKSSARSAQLLFDELLYTLR